MPEWTELWMTPNLPTSCTSFRLNPHNQLRWPKRPSDCQLQEARKKDADRAITPVAGAVHVPAHLVPPESLQTKQLCHLYAQLSLGQSCHKQKKLASMHTGLLWSCPTLCDPVDCGLPGFSVRDGGSPGKNTGAYWQIIAIPF